MTIKQIKNKRLYQRRFRSEFIKILKQNNEVFNHYLRTKDILRCFELNGEWRGVFFNYVYVGDFTFKREEKTG